jgi:DNA-binding protein HU-beta
MTGKARELIRAELAGEVSKLVDGLTKAKASEIIDAFFLAIQSSLSRGEKVHIVGFGTFEVRQRAARKGRNPRKPEEVINIPARAVPVFRAGKHLKDSVNPPKQKKKRNKPI